MKLKIISDGTPSGTKLINEDTGEMIHLVQKLTWEAKADNFPLTKVTIELLNVPVEITTKTNVTLVEHNCGFKLFEKDIKIISEPQTLASSNVKIYDAETNQPVGAVQDIVWEANTSEINSNLTKVKFGKDWI